MTKQNNKITNFGLQFNLITVRSGIKSNSLVTANTKHCLWIFPTYGMIHSAVRQKVKPGDRRRMFYLILLKFCQIKYSFGSRGHRRDKLKSRGSRALNHLMTFSGVRFLYNPISSALITSEKIV
jgi:hypothetical protein